MNTIVILIILLIVAIVLYRWHVWRLRRYRARLIDSYRFPKKIYDELERRYPQLTPAQLDTVVKGLRIYFHICNESNKRYVAMPSQAVDSAWHEFILFTREYHRFCKRALGRFLHHNPAESMQSATVAQEGIRRAWRLSCLRENIDPLRPHRLPVLFAIDALFDIKNGFKYSLDCQKRGAHPFCAGHIGCHGASSCGGDTGGCSSGCGGCGGG